MATTTKLTENALRAEHHRLGAEEASHRRLAEQFKERRAQLKVRAKADGLGHIVAELEAPPCINPPRVKEATVRVRVLESFSSERDGLLFYGAKDSVVELPRGFVAAAAHLFERVSDDVPLFRPAVAWPR
jgi:hypothetical protein